MCQMWSGLKLFLKNVCGQNLNFFVLAVGLLCQVAEKLSRLFGCLTVSFLVAVGGKLLRKCLRRTVGFYHYH